MLQLEASIAKRISQLVGLQKNLQQILVEAKTLWVLGMPLFLPSFLFFWSALASTPAQSSARAGG